MGKKYIIELEEVPFIQHFKNGAWETIYRVKGFNSLVFDWNGLNMLTPYTEPDLDKVKADAYNDGYDVGHKDGREAEKVRQPDLDQVRKEVYDKCMDEAEMTAYKLYSPKIDEAYQRGLADAWEATRKIRGMTWNEQKEVFGTDYFTDIIALPASECIEKIRQYEQEKEEQIQVGDEVINQNKTAVVTEITNRYTRIMYSDGSGYALFSENMTKTGRNFPEIAEVLAKMKETDNG